MQAALARVLWLEPLWIGLLAPSLLFPGRFWVAAWQPALVVLLFAFWPLRLAVLHTIAVPCRLLLPVGALAAAAAFALAVSPFPGASWEAAGYLLLGAALALALVQWPPVRRHPEYVAWLLLALGIVLAAAGPLLLGAMPTKYGLGALFPAAGGLTAALGETINPNVLGGALVIPTLLAAALAIGPRAAQQPWRWLWAVLGLVLLAVLLLTQCRGAWLGAAAGAALLISVRWPRLAWVTTPAALLAAVLLLSGLGLALVFDAVDGAAPAGAVRGRPAIWQFAAEVAARNPLHGAGLGLFAAVQPAAPDGAAGRAPHAHNLLLQATMDLGVLGLAAYAGVLASVAVMLVHLLRRRPVFRARRCSSAAAQDYPLPVLSRPRCHLHRNEAHRRRLHWTLALGTAAALTAVFVHGLVDAALWGNKAAFLPWLLFALTASLYQFGKEVV